MCYEVLTEALSNNYIHYQSKRLEHPSFYCFLENYAVECLIVFWNENVEQKKQLKFKKKRDGNNL